MYRLRARSSASGAVAIRLRVLFLSNDRGFEADKVHVWQMKITDFSVLAPLSFVAAARSVVFRSKTADLLIAAHGGVVMTDFRLSGPLDR